MSNPAELLEVEIPPTSRGLFEVADLILAARDTLPRGVQVPLLLAYAEAIEEIADRYQELRGILVIARRLRVEIPTRQIDR